VHVCLPKKINVLSGFIESEFLKSELFFIFSSVMKNKLKNTFYYLAMSRKITY
jgi:hypothetical protein